MLFPNPAEQDNEAAANDDNDITNDSDIMIGCDFDGELQEAATHVALNQVNKILSRQNEIKYC